MIQVIERFHRIIEHVAEEPERPCGLSELARTIGVSLPACSNIVRTMVQLGYLQTLGERKGYILGSMPYHLTRKGPFKKRLTEAARPHMEALAESLKEMIVLVAECNGRRTELLRIEGGSLVQINASMTEGKAGLFGSATGMLILSHMDVERAKALWDARQETESIVKARSFEELQDVFSKIREKGSFVKELDDDKDPLNESVTLAFPVFENGKLCAALGSRIPAYRFTGERKSLALSSCRSAAERISRNLAKE